ncbi:FAD binding domain-containing protein [Symbioplanes lichenis]|uniref:FAD binding domain-containing protein n=1 Tax=Symbioplanes lichenis TaxID=1629072 RepID=UPI00273A1B75|nr:FAD binding domain-containing protein [Actinoplanes lichenis]
MEYIAAKDPDEVTAALADGDTVVLAGGQSLVLDVTNHALCPARVVDINAVAEFELLTETEGVLRAGPLVRHRTFESDAVGGALGAMLRTVVRHIGHPPIRARGTMAGSLAYAHPAAEWPVLAVILGAELELVTERGRRTVPAERFFTGSFTTVRRPDELLAEVRLPLLPAGTGAGFAEHRPARAKFAETAAMAAVTVVDGLITTALIGLVNAGPCPVRARAAEQVLRGAPFSDAAIRAAAEAAAELDADLSALPAGDRPAKQRAVRMLTRRALTQAREGL